MDKYVRSCSPTRSETVEAGTREEAFNKLCPRCLIRDECGWPITIAEKEPPPAITPGQLSLFEEDE